MLLRPVGPSLPNETLRRTSSRAPFNFRQALYVFCGRHLLDAKLRRAGLDAADGAVARHVDISIVRLQELLGHKTLTMTMKLYAKVRPQNKRQAVAKLSYGGGVTAPAHLVEFPAAGAKTVQVGHQSVTTSAAQA